MSPVRRINLYVDAETDKLIDRLVKAEKKRRGVTSRSEVVRRAVRELAERELTRAT